MYITSMNVLLRCLIIYGMVKIHITQKPRPAKPERELVIDPTKGLDKVQSFLKKVKNKGKAVKEALKE